MTNKEYDLIVIGAGGAGSTAADNIELIIITKGE
jgi:succinate dehydrogenase/fumarate reductase flavoprotein subunit